MTAPRALRLAAAVVAAVAVAFIAAPADVFAQGRDGAARLPRIAIDESAAPIEAAATEKPLPFPRLVRLAGVPGDRAFEQRVAGYAARRQPLWLAVDAPATLDAVEPWRAALRQLIARHGESVAILEIAAGTDARVTGFALRLAATEARASAEFTRVALRCDAAALNSLYTTDLAPYVDLLTLDAAADRAAAAAYLARVDPETPLLVVAGDAGDTADVAAARMLESQLETAGTNVAAVVWTASPASPAALARLAPIARLIDGEVTPIDAGAAGLVLTLDGADVTTSLRHRLLFDTQSFATYLVYWGAAQSSPLQVSLSVPVEGEPALYRLSDGTKQAVSGYSRDAATGRVRAAVTLAGGPMLVDFNEGATAVFVERSGVSAERMLTVEEIIARHQQQQRAQDALVRNYVATARTSQHFRPTMTDPGYDVVTDNRYFVAADGIEWEELSFSVNGSKWGADRPPFPLLQPEKVLSLPLQLRFDNDYRYRLDGTERVGEYDCYVVRFEPVNASVTGSFYKGTVWIERATFARVKVVAVQNGLSAPVVSNEEIQEYRPVTSIGNRPVFLFTGLTARQIMMIAGRNILVEKSVAFGDFRVNDPGFDEARQTARRGDAIMYRETDRGLRYYVKEGETRVVSERATRTARALAMGVTLDPSYAFPLPIFGINYLNFEFGSPDTQLAVLFAGVLAAINVQKPKLGNTPFDASVDFFGIAVPSSDRVYDAQGEHDDERLLTWPLTTGVNLGWQYTPFQKATFQYQFRFDGFARDTTTSDAFVVPASTITNGFGGAWEYRRGGYSVAANGAWFTRAGWRDWGLEPDPASKPTYVKYSASVSRDFYFNVFHKIHLNGAWFGGRDLDRFAKYQFGMFDDTRIHGVPASGARFEELAMARGSYSFNIFEQYRVDLFAEQAWGRDKALDPAWHPITGIGAALNLRAPWGTILRVDAGKSFLPDRYEGIGSATLQVMLLKPLR